VPGGGDGFRLGERIIIGHAPEHAGVFLDHPGTEQAIHRLLRNPQARDELRAVRRFFLGGEVVEDLGLAWGLATELGERLRIGRGNQREQTAQDGADPFAHRGGQDRLKDRIKPATVIPGHPLGEFAHIGRQHRLLVLEQNDAAQLGGGGRFGGIFPDHPEARATTKRDADQLTDLQGILQRRRDRIRVGPSPAIKRDHLGDAGFDFTEKIGHGEEHSPSGGPVSSRGRGETENHFPSGLSALSQGLAGMAS